MKWIAHTLTSLFRSRRRTLLTMSAIALAMFIFGTLQTILTAMEAAIHTSGDGVRLAVIERYGGPRTELPESYGPQLARIEHVAAVTPLNFNLLSLGSSSSGPFYVTFAIDPEPYRIIFPSLADQVSAAEYNCFIASRNGALIGASIAETNHWRAGERIRLGTLIDRADLDLVVCGVLTDRLGTNTQVETQILVNRAYYREVAKKQGLVHLYWLGIDRPDSVPSVLRNVTERFVDGPMEVTVQTESSMLNRMGQFTATIRLIIQVVSAAVLFTVLVVSANTIALSMRERRKEIAVMKALGFTRRHVLTLIVLESALSALLAGAAGAAGAWAVFQARGFAQSFGVAYTFEMTPAVVAIIIGTSLLLGVASAAVPAYRASRVNVISTLHSV